MPRRVLVSTSDSSFPLVESPAPSEHSLQEVVKANPQLIPAEDLGFDDDLLVIGRETTLASGSIDLLCLARTGDLVLIEFKTGPQNPDFRAALAQLIDYGSDLWRMTVEEFDRGVVQRYFAGTRAGNPGHDLESAIDACPWELDPEERSELHARLADVLETGDFFYVVAAQRFTEQMKSSLEYLNSTMRVAQFYLVEVIQLTGADLTAHAAQVVASPPRKQAGSHAGNRSRDRADQETFLASLPAEAERAAMAELFDACASLGIEIKWRSKGASLRIPTPDRKQPLSIAWVFPDGEGWSVTRDLSLGVDHSSLAKTPSVAAAVHAYLARVRSIPHGERIEGKNVEAVAFRPAHVPEAVPHIVSALESLVQAVNGTPE